MRKIITISLLCTLIAGIFAGCSILGGLGSNNKEALQPVSSIAMGEDQAQQLSDKVPVHLYFSSADGNKLSLEVRYIPMSEARKSTGNLATIIVNELINGPTTPELKRTIPEGTKLNSSVSVSDGVATVNFSKDIIEKHPGGKVQEQLTIYSVVDALTELKDIEKVKFTIDGKSQNEFKGSFRFDLPFPRYASIISSQTISAANGSDVSDSANQGTVKASAAKTTPKSTPASTLKKDETKGTSSISSNQSLDQAKEDSEGAYLESLDGEEILE